MDCGKKQKEAPWAGQLKIRAIKDKPLASVIALKHGSKYTANKGAHGLFVTCVLLLGSTRIKGEFRRRADKLGNERIGSLYIVRRTLFVSL